MQPDAVLMAEKQEKAAVNTCRQKSSSQRRQTKKDSIPAVAAQDAKEARINATAGDSNTSVEKATTTTH